MPGGWGFRFVQIKGLNKENFDKKSSSHEPLAGMHLYLYLYYGARRFNFLKIKSLV